MVKKLCISVSLMLLLALLGGFFWYGIQPQAYTANQINLFLQINHVLAQAGNVFWLNITTLGDALLLFPLLSFLVIKYPRAWAAFFGAIPLSTLLSRATKAYFSMPRPAAVIDTDKINIIGETLRGHSSLPSGHTITIFTTVTVLITLLFYGDKKVSHSVVWVLGLLCIATMVAASRIAVGAHWPLDTLLGAIFGVMGGLSGVWLTYKSNVWWHWMTMPKAKYMHIGLLIMLSTAMMLVYSQLLLAWLALFVVAAVIIKLLQSKVVAP